jgi:hypothetical protein
LPQSFGAAQLSSKALADVLGTAESAPKNTVTAAAAASTTGRVSDSFIIQEPQVAGYAAVRKQQKPQQPDPAIAQQTKFKSIKEESASIQQQQQQQLVPASPLSPELAAAAEIPPLAAWQVAVNRRVSSTASSAASNTLSSSSSRRGSPTHPHSSSRTPASRKVALSRLSRHISNSSSSSRPGSPTASSAPAPNRSSSSSAAADVLAGLQPGQLAYGQRLSPEAELQLCCMYQVSCNGNCSSSSIDSISSTVESAVKCLQCVQHVPGELQLQSRQQQQQHS